MQGNKPCFVLRIIPFEKNLFFGYIHVLIIVGLGMEGEGRKVVQCCIFSFLVGQFSPYVVHVFVFILVICSIYVFMLVTCSVYVCVSGKRFNYTFYDKSCGKIWQSIETLDKAVRIDLILVLSLIHI